MECTVLLFGITRDMVGSGKTSVELGEGASVAELMGSLRETYPELGQLKQLLIAVNNEYATDSTVLSEKDEIALIPPVSGG